MAFNVDSHSPAIRTSITDSRVDAPQLDVMESRPFAPGDLVTFRRNAEGGYRVRLEWPTMIAELGNLRRERWMADDTVRGERNYVTNPWARTWNSSFQAPGWVLNSTRESRYYSRDNSNWTAFTAQANGAGNTVGSITLTLRNMTPGDVLEPGDYFTSIGRYVVARAVVNGSGIIAVTLHGALSGTIVDGTSVTVRRPPQPTWMAGLTEGVVVSGATGASAESGVTFAVPYYEGLTTLWCTVECYVWVAAGALAPSTALALVTRVTSATTVAVTPSLDATVYSDPSVLLGPFILSYRHTLTPGDVMSLAARLTLPPDGSAGSLYIRRFQATLGPEADIAPPFEFNADAAALFHAGQRTLRDRGNAPVQYTVKVIESDDAPFTPGGAVDLRHPAPGIVATPRTLAVTRTLTPDLESDDVPVVRLDNLPPSLSRRLSSSGVS
jgi:hypothetical protein